MFHCYKRGLTITSIHADKCSILLDPEEAPHLFKLSFEIERLSGALDEIQAKNSIDKYQCCNMATNVMMTWHVEISRD